MYIEFRGGACIGLVFLMLWLGKWHRRSGVITGAEWIFYRFGNEGWGKCARLAMVLAIVVMTVGGLAYAFKGAGLFLTMFIPLSPFTCSVILMVITTIYTLEAGFYGVVVSDIFQSICIVIGVVFIIILAVTKIAGVNDFGAIAASVTGNADWLSTAPKWHTTMPKGYEQYSYITLIALMYLAKSSIQGLGMGTDPKYFGAKSDRDCGLLSFSSGWFLMMRWPLMLGCAILGIFLVRDLFPDRSVILKSAEFIRYYVPAADATSWSGIIADIMNHPANYPQALTSELKNLLGTDWARKLSLVSFNGIVDAERILPAVILFNIPVGMRGLLIVALLAAAMSTFNAIINAATGYLTRDLYQAYIRPKASNKELIYMSYLFGFLLVTFGMLLSLSTRSINDIWGWIAVSLTSGLAVPTILRLYWWRFNSGGFAIGTIVGLLAAVLQRLLIPQMLEWHQFVYMICTGLVGSIVGTYITRPTDRAVLENFYRTTRPFGLWGPLKNILSPELRELTKKEHFYDLISVPFALIWLITMFLLPMQLMVGQVRSFFITLIPFVVSITGLYFFWYRNLSAFETKK